MTATYEIVQVLDLEKRRCEAIALGDRDMLNAIFSEEYIHCHTTAVLHDKKQIIEHILQSPRTVEQRTPTVRLYGDTAILTGELIAKIEQETGLLLLKMFATRVAHKLDGTWRFVSFHSTRVES